MSDAHVRFRSALAAHLAEVLPEQDAAWMEAHATECAACAGFLAAVRARLPGLGGDAEHAPVSLLARWVREPGSFTALERELLERHLASCEVCREDAAEMSRLSGLAPLAPAAARRSRLPLGLALAAAAVVAVVFTARLGERSRPQVPEPPAPQPAPSAPAAPRTVTLLERTRGTVAGPAPVSPAPDSGAALRLRVPPLFLDGSQDVLVRLVREDGTVAWEAQLAASALRDTLHPATPAAGWRAGRYRLLLVPAGGRDTAATREFGFRLTEPAPR